MSRGWREPLEEIEQLHLITGKPVVFTELGYKSVPFTAREPWLWPDRRSPVSDPRAFDAQAEAYEAFFSAVWPKAWVEGVYFWKWYPSNVLSPERASGDFTPQGKPAENVMTRWFTGDAAGERSNEPD